MNKYVCIHGHFYQPPRENPWLETVEMQESAYPNHDWNERITRECYAANAKARLLDPGGRIERLVSNYARMSFNFGPTLLSWLAEKAPAAYAAILAADKASMERFGGHGSALAQGYNHAIVPLCNERDRRTQVTWGIRDFAARFGRKPEGFWLPETAANTASLEALAEAGITFTVLAPNQAARVRPTQGGAGAAWHELHGTVDPGQAYLCRLPSGRTIHLFFYDGPVARGVAFEGLLHSGHRFAERLVGLFDSYPEKESPRLAHIATDGESYGHHHRYGEMALAAALEEIERRGDVKLINYGQFLELHPPRMEVQIHENSSWSCAHGIERWKSDCGCNSRRDYHQRWRGPLRGALDWLRDKIAPAYEKAAGVLLRDVWGARDGYIDVILDRSPASVEGFFARWQTRALSPEERTRALELLEIQRHAMLMYTSCGWFFDDISGIETAQILQYAGRVIQLALRVLGMELEDEFKRCLESAEGNTAARPNGRVVYEQCVEPAMVDLPRVGAHYAITSLFANDGTGEQVYCFNARREGEVRRRSEGRARLLVGRAEFESRITLERTRLSYAVLHMGDHIVNCGIRKCGPGQEPDDETLYKAMEEAFDRADFPEVIRRLDGAFGKGVYTVGSLFRDEQHAVVRKILEGPLAQIDAAYLQIYERNAPLARFLKQLNLTVLRRIQMVSGFVLTQTIRKLLTEERPDLVRLEELRAEAEREAIWLDESTVGAAAREALVRAAERVAAQGEQAASLEIMLGVTRYVRKLPFHVDLWPAQEVFIECVRGRESNEGQQKVMRELGEALMVKVPG
jgi:alpha-amylase/alpha-mannosidase (GH57 family)